MAVIKYETPDGPIEYDVAASKISYEEETEHWRVKAGEKKRAGCLRTHPTRTGVFGSGRRCKERDLSDANEVGSDS